MGSGSCPKDQGTGGEEMASSCTRGGLVFGYLGKSFHQKGCCALGQGRGGVLIPGGILKPCGGGTWGHGAGLGNSWTGS